MEAKNVDHRSIQELVTKIKKLKGNYCHEYDRYETKSQELWNKVQQYEAQLEYQLKMSSLYE